MIVLKENEFIRLSTYLLNNYGINLTQKKILIEGRLSNLIVEKGFKNFGDYIDFIFSDTTGTEISLLINKVTTNHTFFMREATHFEYFRDTVLPYLEMTEKDRDLRIWSAGCSSGEEPYTLQMIIRDYFGDKIKLWNTKVLATDISERVLQIAERALYSEEAIVNIPQRWKEKYFTKYDKGNYQILDEIKNEIIFRSFNLMEDYFPFKKKFHVIFCRNVMIYFEPKTKVELINKFYDMTETGGYLFIGHSESINKDETKYKYVIPAVYRKG